MKSKEKNPENRPVHAPLDVMTRIRVAMCATTFFNPVSFVKNHEVLRRAPPAGAMSRFTAFDFIQFLANSKILPEAVRRKQRIRELLDQLVARGILIEYPSVDGDYILGNRYSFIRELTAVERTNFLWLAPALGPDALAAAFADVVVQLTGKTNDMASHAGTGILIAPRAILTCAHVLTEMNLDSKQMIQGSECTVMRQHHHSRIDVGVVEISESRKSLTGLAFHEPQLLDEVYILGYPRVPFTRSAALITHRGEVTNASVTTLDGHHVFLFSAIARPGNSGGPIISSKGHVVGLVTGDLSVRSEGGRQSETIPFFAGVPTSSIQEAISELECGLELSIEHFH